MTEYTFLMGNDFYPLFCIFEAMTFILIILAIAIGYWLIKGWVNVVNFIFNPLIKKADERDRLKKSILKVKRSNKQPLNQLSEKTNNSISNKVALEIDSIKKWDNYFNTYVRLKNISSKPIFCNLGECYFVTEKGLQIKGDTTRLVYNHQKNINRILPNLHIVRHIAFYNEYVNFSENDMLACEVIIDNKPHLLTTNLKTSNIQSVALDVEMV